MQYRHWRKISVLSLSMLSHAQNIPRSWVVGRTTLCPPYCMCAHTCSTRSSSETLNITLPCYGSRYNPSSPRFAIPCYHLSLTARHRVLPILVSIFRRHLIVSSRRSNYSNNIHAHERTFGTQQPSPRQ